METIIEVIIKLVVEWIELSIWLIGFVGVLAFLCCYGGICTRRDELEGKKSSKRKKGEDQKPAHLQNISDKHELALHKEAHRSSKAWLYTIVSVLLITGICGTMLEVHTKLWDHPLRLNGVLSVLGPAKLAVGWSIALLIFKGLYIHCVEDYMQRHDFAAMEELTVQREKEGRISGDEYEKIASKIQLLHGALSNYTKGCDHALVEMRKELVASRKPAPQWVNFSYEMPIITMDAKAGEIDLYRMSATALKSEGFPSNTVQVEVPDGTYPAEKLATQS